MVGFAGPVLGESFRKPEREKSVGRNSVIAHDPQHTGIGEYVHELVADHSPEVVNISIRRYDDASLEKLKESSNTVGDKARRNIRLLEVQV
jgi:hypothetical protein